MKAYELLDSPEKWTKKAIARNNIGERVYPHDLDATCWCLRGAIEKCYGINTLRVVEAEMRLSDVLENKGYISTPEDYNKPDDYTVWNDAGKTTYEDVLSVLKEAKV